jgi:peptidyl-Asp metalloendopeptidase
MPRIRRTVAALLLSTTTPVLAADLFSELPARSQSVARMDRVVQALREDRTTASLALVAVDAAAVGPDTPQLRLAMADGLDLDVRRDSAHVNEDGTVVWTGNARASGSRSRAAGHHAGSEVILVRDGTDVAGTVRASGRLFRIEPLAGRGHALVEIDESAWPADHPAGALPDAGTAPGASAGMLSLDAGASAGTPSFPRRTPRVNPPPPAQTSIDAMVVMTDAAAAAVGNPQAFIQLAIAETNVGYRNSGVPITLRLAGWYTTSYVTADFNTDLDRFTGQADGFLDEFHARRDQIGADVNVLLIRDPAYQYCGLAWLNASAAHAFSVTDHRCATGNYTFAHEIGHNQGAHHDPDNSTNSYFSYGHGYPQPTHGWRTIMAYACSGGQACPRINAWSTPQRYRDRVPMGNRNRSDNARVLRETRSVVAGFR